MKPPPSDVHFLTAPLKFVWGMILWAVFLLLSPFIFLGVLVFGINFMSADEINLMKVLVVVLGPFAFVFWWIIAEHFSGRYQAKHLIAGRSQSGDDYSEAEIKVLEDVGKPRHIRNLMVLFVSLVGSVYGAHLFYSADDQHFFVGVLAGIVSPAILVAAYRLSVRFLREDA